MKVTVQDSAILKTIEPGELAEHLKIKGWHEEGRIYNNFGSIWRLKKDSEDEEFEILLPLKQSLGDYAARISDALKTLEEVEGRSQLDILSDLITSAPNIKIQGIVTEVKAEIHQVTMIGVVVGKLRKIAIALSEVEYNLAVKAYQERVPVAIAGDLIKDSNTFVLKNPRNLSFDDAWQN